MFNPFPVEPAHEVCRTLLSQVQNGEVRIELTGKPSGRSEQGVMLGVLVCKDKNGNTVVLKTNSGISKKLLHSSNMAYNCGYFSSLTSSA